MKKRPGEFELIARYFAPLAGEGAFRLLDDAALLDVPEGKKLVVTQDALVENVHFFSDDPPHLIAKKALRVNFSDLAAKGATPFAYSLALGLSPDWSEKWVASFARGLAEDQAGFCVYLSGGDTYQSPAGTNLSITAFGLVDADKYTSRLGAQPGDHLFVTGTIGDAALGLMQRRGDIDSRALAKHEKSYLVDRYLLPQPATFLADIIGEFASASMDISDGLLGDLAKLCKASGVAATLKVADIPLSGPVRKLTKLMPDGLQTALTGGDDYEFLMAVPRQKKTEFNNATGALPVKISEIGIVNDGADGVLLVAEDGSSISFERDSYQHF